MKKTVLIIEDEPAIRMAIKDELEFEGFQVRLAKDGPAGLESILHFPPHLVVLDLMLPGKNGFEVCRDIRERGITIPVIVLTARGRETDKIRGLELGADDYLTKPVSLAELVARIRAVLRRCDREESGDILRCGTITVDLRKHQVFRGDAAVEVTDKEFQILTLLLKRSSEVVTRDDFLNAIWGEDVYVTHRTIDTHIAALRRKIEDDPEHPRHIVSVRNVGYKFHPDV
ncbi:MAG: response regulator transcription factor [Acidobacteria bacterium]|nr:response regulator transcription factor [Acidobacteriota bacterium]